MVFASQAPDGTWRKGEPIFASGEAVASSTNAGGPGPTATAAATTTSTSSSSVNSGTAASSGGKRDIGNSYVFFYDIVEALMVSMGDKQPHLLAPYLPHLERCVAWAEENQLEEVCDFASSVSSARQWFSSPPHSIRRTAHRASTSFDPC